MEVKISATMCSKTTYSYLSCQKNVIYLACREGGSNMARYSTVHYILNSGTTISIKSLWLAEFLKIYKYLPWVHMTQHMVNESIQVALS